MSDRDVPDSGQTFRIGTVSRLTGVPTDTLRVWERRYHVVTPVRSEAGTRHYAAEDVGRLSLIKRLVDGGDAISSVANLSLSDLRERMRGADTPERFSTAEQPCRVVVCGTYLANRVRREPARYEGLELLACLESAEALRELALPVPPDVLVIELPTLHSEHAQIVHQLLSRTKASRALLVYGFASGSALDLLDPARVMTRRAPVGPQELRQACLDAMSGRRPLAQTRSADILDGLDPPPARQYGDAELARIAAATASSECDWSRHLVDLVSSLAAFESYAAECGGRNAEGAALVSFVGACTAHARAFMEAALERSLPPEQAERPID